MIMTQLPGVTSYLTTIETRLKNSNYKYWRRILVILTSSSIFIALNGCLKTFFSFSLYGAPVSPIILATFWYILSLRSKQDTELKDQFECTGKITLNLRHKNYSPTVRYRLHPGSDIGILHVAGYFGAPSHYWLV